MRKPSKTFQPTANDAFIARCFEIDALLAELQTLRGDHFGAPAEGVHWGHVGDAAHVAEKLQDIVNHFRPDTETVYSYAYINGRKVRVSIPGRE
jgi:hypothetical protein